MKAITAAEGGAVTTNSAELAEKLRRFRSHGSEADPSRGGWYYDIPELGYNFRISDVHSALATSQLGKLERFIERRNEIAARYRTLLADLPIELPPAAPSGWRHAYHLFPIRVADRRAVYDVMHAEDIGVQVHYVPITHHPVYRRRGIRPEDYPETERAYGGLLSIPMYPDLTDDQQDRVVEVLRNAVSS